MVVITSLQNECRSGAGRRRGGFPVEGGQTFKSI
jgi:hypothetical protein